jgi:D-arabinose 1-dehydrogenase-like Zn-dependent alcohol dehydrogenase
MSDIPSLPYKLLYHERVIRTVANNTWQDGRDFLELATRIPIRTSLEVYPLTEANRALQSLKTMSSKALQCWRSRDSGPLTEQQSLSQAELETLQ